MALEVQHNGYIIVYIERDNKWVAYPEGAEQTMNNKVSESQSLANCKMNVDSRQHRLNREKFKPISAFLYENYGQQKFKPCNVTSKELLTEDQIKRGLEYEYFITITETKRHEKVRASCIILDTEENRTFITKYVNNEAHIETIFEENKQLLEQMETMD